jgi:two-component system sensor histidine kinase KdpD
MNTNTWSGFNNLSDGRKLAGAVLACVLTTLVATPLLGILDLANIVMLFLLTVLLVAMSLGRGAAVLAAFLSVVLFDFFFVPPRFSLAVHDAQYLVTFAVMLAVALITAQLAAGLRRQAEIAAEREKQARELYEMARELAGALTVEQVAATARRFLRDAVDADAALLLPGAAGKLTPVAMDEAPPGVESVMARLAFDSGVPVDANEYVVGNYATACFPLKAPMRVRGVLAVRPLDAAADTVHEQKSLLETVASLVAIAVERLHYVEVAQQTQVEMVAERLRSSILSALSHDLRTPLTALVGLADSLTLLTRRNKE